VIYFFSIDEIEGDSPKGEFKESTMAAVNR